MDGNRDTGRLYRVLWNVKWRFELFLVYDDEGDIWKDSININEITKNTDKIILYDLYINNYRTLIDNGIAFREKYYLNLSQNIVINYLDHEFIGDMVKLYRDLIECYKIYHQFIDGLNWFEEKRYNETKKMVKYPEIKIIFSLSNKGVEC